MMSRPLVDRGRSELGLEEAAMHMIVPMKSPEAILLKRMMEIRCSTEENEVSLLLPEYTTRDYIEDYIPVISELFRAGNIRWSIKGGQTMTPTNFTRKLVIMHE